MSDLRRGPDRPAGEVRRPRARFLRAPRFTTVGAAYHAARCRKGKKIRAAWYARHICPACNTILNDDCRGRIVCGPLPGGEKTGPHGMRPLRGGFDGFDRQSGQGGVFNNRLKGSGVLRSKRAGAPLDGRLKAGIARRNPRGEAGPGRTDAPPGCVKRVMASRRRSPRLPGRRAPPSRP